MQISEKLRKTLLKRFQPATYKGYIKGYAASVELDGKPLLKLYSGDAEDVETDGIYRPVNANTRFDVASIAKQFVACCAAILACENRLNMDDSVRVYLPEMKDYADNITVRHCIFMTSGVRNIQLLKHFMSASPLGEMEIFFRQEQPENEPGNFNGYSETCYEILGHIVERLTGSVALFARQRIFEPLEMENTYAEEGPGSYIMGGGGLISTAEDLVKWHNCLMNKNFPGAPRGLFDMLFSTFALNNGEPCPYGFGFFYDESGRDTIWQWGSSGTWQSIIKTDLKRKLSIVILTCSEFDPVEAALDLENVILKDVFGLPERGNYKTAYYDRPIHTAEARQVNHTGFPNARRQNPGTDGEIIKYLGRYYGYEIDTYFEIFPDGGGVQMKYADNDGYGYSNLLDFTDEARPTARTRGDWGAYRFPIEFYGSERKIDFFVLHRGRGAPFADENGIRAGHFNFIKK